MYILKFHDEAGEVKALTSKTPLTMRQSNDKYEIYDEDGAVFAIINRTKLISYHDDATEKKDEQ